MSNGEARRAQGSGSAAAFGGLMLLGSLALQSVSLVLGVGLARLAGPEVLGVFRASHVPYSMAIATVGVALGIVIPRMAGQVSGGGTLSRQRLIGAAFRLHMLSLPFGLLTGGGAWWLVGDEIAAPGVLGIIASTGFTLAVGGVPALAIVLGSRRFVAFYYGAQIMLPKVALLGVLMVSRMDINSFLALEGFLNFLVFILVWMPLLRGAVFREPDATAIRRAVLELKRFVLTLLVGAAAVQADLLVAARVLSVTDLGIYSAGALELPGAVLLQTSLMAAAFPAMVYRFRDGATGAAIRLWQRNVSRLLPLFLASGAMVAGLAPVLVEILYGPEFAGAVPVMQVYALLLPLRAFGFVHLTRALGRTRGDLAGSSTWLLGTFGLALLLHPALGLTGLAAAFVCAAAVATVVQYRIIHTYLDAPLLTIQWAFPIVRGLTAGSLLIGSLPVVHAGSGSIGGAVIRCGVAAVALLLIWPEASYVLDILRRGVARGAASPDGHLVLVPSGADALLGGARSAMDSWAPRPEVATVGTAPDSPAERYARKKGLSVVKVPLLDAFRGGRRTYRIGLAIQWIFKGSRALVRAETVEVESNHLLEVGLVARMVGVPLLASIRDFPRRRLRPSQLPLWATPALFYALNESIAASMRGQLRSQVFVVRNGVLDSQPTLALADASPERRAILVGLLSPKKGQLKFLETIWPGVDKSWVLELVGALGPNDSYNEACACAAVTAGGDIWLRGPVEEWWKRLTRPVLVLPSVREGNPRVVIEALGRGIPVVLSAYPGSELFAEVPGAWVARTPREWAAALDFAYRYVWNDEDRRALKAFLDAFGTEKVASELTKLWTYHVR